MSRPPSESGGPDPFAVLGIEARFDLDPAAVRAAFRDRAAAMHPDRAADPAARATLARASAELAEAQRVLLDPVRRGEALLASLGGAAPASPPSGEFLVEMMEIREGIDAAAGDPGGLEGIRIEIDERFGLACDRLSATLSELSELPELSGPGGPGGRPDTDRVGGRRIAAEILGVMRYLQRLRRAVDDASADSGGGEGAS